MKLKSRGLVLVLILFLWIFAPGLLSGAAAGNDAEEILTALQHRYVHVTSLTADYTRVTSTPAMEGVFQTSAKHTASGLLMFKKPAQLILSQAAPRTEKLVTDGGTVWWYIPEENVVHRYTNVDLHGELKPLLDFLGGLGRLEGHFTVKVTPAGTDGQKHHRLELHRLQEGSGPARITVWFEPQELNLAGFRLTSVMGETTDFNLSNVQFNPEFEDGLFYFRIPPGAEVIDEEPAR